MKLFFSEFDTDMAQLQNPTDRRQTIWLFTKSGGDMTQGSPKRNPESDLNEI